MCGNEVDCKLGMLAEKYSHGALEDVRAPKPSKPCRMASAMARRNCATSAIFVHVDNL